jgi:peptidoglycan/LPS O-acetylase OafA/YrhL
MKAAQRFITLDSFRGVCAVLVVFCNLHVVGAFILLPFFRRDDLLLNFFLVLSGFVLAHAYGMKPTFSFKSFLIARVFRLYPLHLLMLAVFLIFELIRWSAYNKGFYLNNVPFTGQFAPAQILPNLLLVQAWTSLSDGLSFNHPAWAVSIEFSVCLLFCALCLFSLRNRFLIFGCVSLAALGLILDGNELLLEPMLVGVMCFFAGNLTYLLYLKIHERFAPGRLIMTLLECAMLFATYWMLMNELPYRSAAGGVLFCGLVLVFAFEGGMVSDMLKARFFMLLGRLSYAIYMTHAALLFCLSMVFIVAQKVTGLNLAPMINGQRFIDTGSVLGNNLLVLGVAVAAVALAALAHHCIEVKGIAMGKRLANRSAKDKPVVVAATS